MDESDALAVGSDARDVVNKADVRRATAGECAVEVAGRKANVM
jgi:hypothetical protein